jgi:putative tricarboxylic transport membrane protein
MADHAGRVSARADLVGGVAWIAFGVAIVGGALAMDRLEQFGATTYTAPGLVPGLLGAAIALLGMLLAIRALRRGAVAGLAAPWLPTREGRAALRRAGAATLLSLAYTLGMLGRVPFEAATAVFVFAFAMTFGTSAEGPRSPLARRVLVAAVTAVATTVAVALVFERIFLVRLP